MPVSGIGKSISELDRTLLRRLQEGVPAVSEPWRALGEELGLSEEEVLAGVRRLKDSGVVREISAIFDPTRLGYASALVAVEAEPALLDSIADAVNQHPEVTHNYERSHIYNLWFTVIAPKLERIEEIHEATKALPGVKRAALLPARRHFKLSVRFQ